MFFDGVCGLRIGSVAWDSVFDSVLGVDNNALKLCLTFSAPQFLVLCCWKVSNMFVLEQHLN